MMSTAKNIALAAVLVLVLGGLAAPALAEQSQNSIVDLTFPCPAGFGVKCEQISNATTTGAFINSFYQIALAVAGLLALLMIVYGGIKYTVSAGNTGAQEDARDIITSALWGVALLLASYVILNTINPRITSNLNLPGTDIPAPPVPSSTQGLTVADTECITLDPSTWNPSNTSTLSATTTYAQLIPSEGQVWTGASTYYSALNCSYRVGYISTSSNLKIDKDTDGIYYNENTTIPAGSKVWMYPYFSSSSEPTVTDRCLIYAYLPPNTSSSPTMISLNSNLQLCYPHNQIVPNQ